MKLRQKLAVVMASAMVLTSVPVVTMAASTSYVAKVSVTEDKGAFESTLVIDVKDASKSTTDQIVYLELNGAKFDTTKYTDTATYTVSEDEKTLAVNLGKEVSATKLSVPVYGKEVSADEVVVTVDGNGTKAIDNETVVVAKRSNAKATVTVADAVGFDGEGEIAKITIEEPFKNVLTGNTITLTLENSNYKFTNAGKVTASKGLAGVTVTSELSDTDDQIITITVPEGLSKEALGKLEITGVTVKCTDKNPAQEDVEVTVSGKKINETTVKVAKVVEYGGSLELSDKAVEIKAGKEKSVDVVLKETLADSFLTGKTVEFMLENGSLTAAPAGTTAIHKDNDDKKEIIGFEYEIKAADKKDGKLNKEFTLKLATEIDQTGEVTLTASGRAIGEDRSLVVADIVAPFEVKMESVNAVAGVKDQKGGKLVITETEKGNIATGTFQIQLEDGVEFSDKAEFKVTSGDMIIEKVAVDSSNKSILNVTVKRASKTASTIEISNFAVKADRVLADGTYEAKLSGTNLGAGEIELENFLVVGQTQAVEASFKVGSNKYTVNGVEKEMDGEVYLSTTNRTMVPVRYVSDAFGISGRDVLYSNGKVTLFAGNRTIQLTIGSNIAVVNGVQITMDEKVVAKDGRTYIPVGEVGRLLGITTRA